MADQPQDDSKSEAPVGRRARFASMFIVLCALFSLGQFHRTSGSVLSPVFVEELGLSAEQIGLVIGVMFVFQGLAQVPAGVLLDRYGTRIIQPLLSMVGVIGCIVIAYAESWIWILVGRALLGLGFSTTLTGAYAVFVRWSKPEMIATISGRYLFFGGIGALFSTVPLAWLLEFFNWRSVFATLGIFTFVAAVLVFIAVRDTPDGFRTAGSKTEKKTLRGSILGVAMVIMDRRVWPALAISFFMYTPGLILIGIWAGPFFKDVHQLGAVERSYILLALALAMNVGMLMYGPIERLFNTRRSVALGGMTIVAVSFAIVAISGYQSIWASVVLFTLITLVSPYFVVVHAHSQALFPPEYASRVLSLINLVALPGIFAMQYGTGYLIGAFTDDPRVTGSVLGYRLMFALMAAIFFVMPLIYSRTRDIPPKS